MSALFTLIALVLLASSTSTSVSATVVTAPSYCLSNLTTCKFSIKFPQSANPPYTSEQLTGTFTYNYNQPQPSPFPGYGAGYVLQTLNGERVLYKGTKQTVFRIVSLIPDLGSPAGLTLYEYGTPAHGHGFDSQQDNTLGS